MRHRCLEVSQRNGKAANRSAPGSQDSVIEPEGLYPDRQISLSGLNPRRRHIFHFPDCLKWNKNDIIAFYFWFHFYSSGHPENKFIGTSGRNITEPLCERNKIYSCLSDSSSSERTMDLVLEMCNTNSIHWCGISGRQLGKLHPSSSLCLALTLLSSVQGLQVRHLFSIWGLLTSGHLLFPFFSSDKLPMNETLHRYLSLNRVSPA